MGAYSDLAYVGRAYSVFKLFMGFIFFIGLVILGIYLIRKKKNYIISRKATLAEPYVGGSSVMIKLLSGNCIGETVPLVNILPEHTPACFTRSKMNGPNVVCSNGSIIPPFEVFVKDGSDCPADAQLINESIETIIGIGVIIFSVLMLMAGIFNVFLTRKSKGLAAAEGALDIAKMFRF